MGRTDSRQIGHVWELEILVMLLNMSIIHHRSACGVWYALIKKQSYVTVASDTLVMMLNWTMLCIMSLCEGTVFQLDGAPHHFCHVYAFLDREFPWSLDWKKGTPFPGPPHSPDFTSLGVCWGHCLFLKSAIYEWAAWQNCYTAECITNEMLASTCLETEYHLGVCCAVNGAYIKIYWAHKKLCRSSVWKCIESSNMLYGWRYILFCFTAI
jgi:hypothetical protein